MNAKTESTLFRPKLLGLAIVALVLSGCGSSENIEYEYPTSKRGQLGQRLSTTEAENRGTILGPGGFGLLGNNNGQPSQSGGGAGIGVNSYLWRASLDTISFMPLSQADPFGGVIITDWFTPDDAPDERFKLNVYILGRELRVDGLRVAVFRQVRGVEADWLDGPVRTGMSSQLENAILTRARQLRIADIQSTE